MKKPPSPNAPPPPRTWQDISQRAGARPLSPVAWRKRAVHGLGWAAMLALAGALGAVGWRAYRQYRKDSGHPAATVAATPLTSVDFQTDGVLTEAWARDYLQLKNGAPLAAYDVFALRQKLLASQQVREAFVERLPPGTLRLRLNERRPMLRVAVDNGAGGYETELVAVDGTVYPGWCYRDEARRALPWLGGVSLHRAKSGGYQPVAGAAAIAALLQAAHERTPELAAQWTVVDLSQYDGRPQAVESLLNVRTRNLGNLVFTALTEPAAYRRPLEQLALVAQDLANKKLPVKLVDLTLAKQVVVEPVAAQTPLGGKLKTR